MPLVAIAHNSLFSAASRKIDPPTRHTGVRLGLKKTRVRGAFAPRAWAP